VKRPPRPNAFRDAWCGELTADREGEEVRVAGWVHRRRDHGGLIFIDLRDRSGVVQLVLHPEDAPDVHASGHRLRSEYVVSARGRVVRRDPQNVNPKIATGEIEVAVSELDQLAESETPPFPIDEGGPLDETLRLRHRPLDLRREGMQQAMILRHEIVRAIREHLSARDFLEIETPILTRSTPEGARDFLVPARLAPGSFYALPQSPQIFKQLLMVAGYERYFQIPRCFRDEDTRADRQLEFTQLDVEMAFVAEDDVIDLVEGLVSDVFAVAGVELPAPPWPRLRFDETVLRYGIDRPDTRFGLEIEDVSEAVAESEFKVFQSAVSDGGVVRGINAGARELPRSDLDALTEQVQGVGAKGLVWAFLEEGGEWRSPVAKFLSERERGGIAGALAAGPGDLLFLVADEPKVAGHALHVVRHEMASRFGLIPDDRHDPLWVLDFPMFGWDEEEERWEALHHPFTAPRGSFDDPGAMRSRAYDLVIDGSEIAGGSIRSHTMDVQSKVFETIGLGEDEAQARFGFLLEHLRYGAPPHGGIAFGIDRLVALLAGRENIREVIPFPKTATGVDPLTGAPAPVDAAQLRELGLRLAAEPGKTRI
jgi:aspartyl-tRNA synthetase